MRRELKFRVWDNKYEKFLGDREWSLENNSHIIIYNEVNEIVDTFYLGDDSRYIVQQFTGLQDNNCEDIYEGDILIQQKPYPDYELEVKFHDGMFICQDITSEKIIKGQNSWDLYELNDISMIFNNVFNTVFETY